MDPLVQRHDASRPETHPVALEPARPAVQFAGGGSVEGAGGVEGVGSVAVSRREFVRRSVSVAGALGVAGPLIQSVALAHAGAGSGGGTITAASASAAIGRGVLGANDSVGVGFIGIGIRGEILMRSTLALQGPRILEVCDIYDGHFDRAKEVMAGGPAVSAGAAGSSGSGNGDGSRGGNGGGKGGPNAGASGSAEALRTGRDYQRLLENKEINAVVIAVPDHWHKQMTLDALAAGKDVYIEKPITHRWEDTADFANAASKHQRMLQVGSQYQSMPANERAIEIIKSGKLGKVTLISGSIHRNTATGAWYYPIPPDASPETIDWKRFIGKSPWHEFDPKRFFQWRLYWDYSGGLPTDLFVHLITATHSLMGVDLMPSRVVGVGATLNWKEREVPDQMSAIAEYPEGFTLTLTSTANNNHAFPLLTIMGTEGTLEYYGTRLVYYAEPQLENYTYSTNSWPAATKRKYAELNDLDPESMRPRATTGKKAPPAESIDTPGQESTQAHLAKFFDSVRTRQQPVENAGMGGRCATVGHMVNLSHKARKEARWDRDKQAVKV